MTGPNLLGRRADWEVTELRIDSQQSLPESGDFLKSWNSDQELIKYLFTYTYGHLISPETKKKRHPVRASIFHDFVWFSRSPPASNAHGHDDVSVAVGLIRERAHLAGGLFVLQLDAHRAIGRGSKKIEHVCGVETDADGVAF